MKTFIIKPAVPVAIAFPLVFFVPLRDILFPLPSLTSL